MRTPTTRIFRGGRKRSPSLETSHERTPRALSPVTGGGLDTRRASVNLEGRLRQPQDGAFRSFTLMSLFECSRCKHALARMGSGAPARRPHDLQLVLGLSAGEDADRGP